MKHRDESDVIETVHRYARLAELGGNGICTIDAEDRITFANDAMARMLGYTLDEIVGQPLSRFCYTGWERIALDRLRERREGVADTRVVKLQRRDGAAVWALFSATPAFDREGRYAGAAYLITDITEWKQSENDLRASEQRFRTVFNWSLNLMAQLSPDGILLAVNEKAARYIEAYGVDQSELLGKPFWETPWWDHSPDQQKLLKDAIARASRGEIVAFDAVHPAPGGGLMQVDFSLKPVPGADGSVELMIAEGHEITDRGRSARWLKVGDIGIDLLHRQVTYRGRQVRLRPKEFDLLVFLASHPGRTFTQSELLDAVWRFDNPADARTVQVHIRWLRQKLEDDPSCPVLIETVRNQGYRLVVEGT